MTVPANGNGSRLVYWLLGALISAVGALSGVAHTMMMRQLDAIEARQERSAADAAELAALRVQVYRLREDFDDVRANGSPITDKRLTRIEERLKIR